MGGFGLPYGTVAVSGVSAGIVTDSLALHIDFLNTDCYTPGAATCTNLGSLSLTATDIPNGVSQWSIVGEHMVNEGNYSFKPTFTHDDIFQDPSSYECWFAPPDTGNNNYGLFGPINFGGSYDQGVWVQMYDTDGSSPVALYVRGGALSPVISIPAADEIINAQVWNHLVLTYEATTCTIYHNGSLVTSGTVAASGNTASGYVIGGTYGYYTHGGYDPGWDITRVYHKILTADEVLQNYDAEKSRFGH